MKKIIVILLIMVYGAASVGATIQFHYCMNKLVGSTIGHAAENKKCSKCGMKEKKGGCCKDEQKQIKLTDAHEKTANNIHFTAPFLPTFVAVLPNFQDATSNANFNFPKSNAPPNISKLRLHVRNCVFLI